MASVVVVVVASSQLEMIWPYSNSLLYLPYWRGGTWGNVAFTFRPIFLTFVPPSTIEQLEQEQERKKESSNRGKNLKQVNKSVRLQRENKEKRVER